MPGLAMLRQYRAAWLGRDLLAGLVLATMLVPVGIAYAVAAGLPGILGLYATIVPLLAYAVFGPSRILVVAPDSALAAVLLAVIVPLSAGDPEKAVALAGAMAIVAGLTCLLAGWGKLGFVTELLSKPIRYGYMNGIALTVLISQLPVLFGAETASGGILDRLQGLLNVLAQGHWNGPATALGIVSLAIIFGLRRWPRIPGILVAVAGSTLVAGLLPDTMPVLGSLPRGFPSFTLPWVSLDDLGPVLLGGFTAAVLSFAETSILSRSYAARLGDRVDPNQEMTGLGMANLATGLFQGFPVSSSASRTPVAEAAGARTQLTGVVGALAVTALLVFAPNLLYHLPYSVLAAVVIAAVWSLFEVTDLKRIYRMQRWEFWLSMFCCAGVLVLGPIEGIVLAIIVSVIEFLWDGWRPHYAVLGRVDGLKGYHDTKRYPHARQIPGLVLFRWDAPLFFANAEWFSRLAQEAVDAAPGGARRLVVTAEPVTSIDVTAADALMELQQTLAGRGVSLCFAEMKDPVKDKLKQFGLYDAFGDTVFYPTIGQAVSDYVARYAPDWVDWEDGPEQAPPAGGAGPQNLT